MHLIIPQDSTKAILFDPPSANEKYYLHPDSEHILEPIVADLGIDDSGDVGKYRLAYKRDESEEELMPSINRPAGFYGQYWESIGKAKIIQRNGIHFMWPEEDYG